MAWLLSEVPVQRRRVTREAQPEVVGGGAAAAQLPAAALGPDQPGDRAFNYGPAPAVDGAQVVTVGPVVAGFAQQRIVGVQVQAGSAGGSWLGEPCVDCGP